MTRIPLDLSPAPPRNTGTDPPETQKVSRDGAPDGHAHTIRRALALLLLVLMLAPRPGHAQSVLKHFLSVGSTTNSTLVHGGPTLVTHIHAGNTTATVYFLKLFAKATAPTCGTDVPVATFPIPPTPASGTAPPLVVAGGALQFPLGVGFCITSGIADNDTGAAAAGIAVNFGLAGYL